MVVKGSGSNVDLCVITAEGTENIRPFDQVATKAPRSVGKERGVL